jgi:hypothetical protein
MQPYNMELQFYKNLSTSTFSRRKKVDIFQQLTWLHDVFSESNVDSRRYIVHSLCRKVDLIDNMLQRLEKYADNLESLVDQRTAELEDEKLRTEKLLSRMLPP